MSAMTAVYLETGRRRQKARTRALLIDAVRRLVAGGGSPTVEEAADAAGVSRATAYRYFPNQRALLLAVRPILDSSSLLAEDPPEDAAERLARTVDELLSFTLEAEPELRTMLRLSLEASADEEALFLRQGRAIQWLETALAPLEGRLEPASLRRLVLAIRAGCGIESLVWLTDVAGLSREEAAEVMRWSSSALLRSALAPASP